MAESRPFANLVVCAPNARVAELVDALDLGSCGVTRESSSLSFRTNLVFTWHASAIQFLSRKTNEGFCC